MSEKRKSSEAPTPDPEKTRTEATKEPPADPKKIVFKIVPADPKNTLNFEDVADK